MNKENKSAVKQPLESKDNSANEELYETPSLTVYGGIAELIKNQPGGGPDGGFPGCTRT